MLPLERFFRNCSGAVCDRELKAVLPDSPPSKLDLIASDSFSGQVTDL